MKQEFEWNEIKYEKNDRGLDVVLEDSLPEEHGTYLLVTNNGGYQIRSFDGEKFSGRYRNMYLAWAEIPSSDHLEIMTETQKKLNKVSEKIRLLQKEKNELELAVLEEKEMRLNESL